MPAGTGSEGQTLIATWEPLTPERVLVNRKFGKRLLEATQADIKLTNKSIPPEKENTSG
jgi:hypothetical protein